jgi:hypothetical protein
MRGSESRVGRGSRSGSREAGVGAGWREKAYIFKFCAVLKIKIRPSFCLGRIGLIKIIKIISIVHYFAT